MSNTPEKPKTKRGFYIVFSPTGPTPPVVIHNSHKSAFQACHQMAEKWPGQKFHVMKSDSRPITREVQPLTPAGS